MQARPALSLDKIGTMALAHLVIAGLVGDGGATEDMKAAVQSGARLDLLAAQVAVRGKPKRSGVRTR
jgi:hypothetical protein